MFKCGLLVAKLTACMSVQSMFALDADGDYDSEATLVRVGEVANGVGNKIACGVIS